MSVGLAPRPANEEQRAKAVVKTGLIESPNPDLFQVYCDLAKDITGFTDATFSLYDGEMQCAIAMTGIDPSEKKPGDKGLRTKHNICSYVLLDTEPLLMHDISKDPVWKAHPRLTESWGYAGFPVINKDNYALGTLCMLNKTPKSLDTNQVDLLKKITANIALLLDLRIEQKEITSEKILSSLINFRKYDNELSIQDFEAFMSMTSNLKVSSSDALKLIQKGICVKVGASVELSSKGRELLSNMKLRTKPMKKIKLSGSQAENLIDNMFAELK